MSQNARELGPLFGVSESAADRIIYDLGPALALQQRKRFREETVLIVDGHLVVPTRDHQVAEQLKNYWYSANRQVIINDDTQLVVAVGRPLPGNRNDCKTWKLSGAKAASATTVIADGGYRGTSLVIQHRRERGQADFPEWKEEHNSPNRKIRARVEHALARMKTWTILRDCRLQGDGVHNAMLSSG